MSAPNDSHSNDSPFQREHCPACAKVTTHNKAGCVPCAERPDDLVLGKLWLVAGLVLLAVALYVSVATFGEYQAIEAEGTRATRGEGLLPPLVLALLGWAFGVNLTVGGARSVLSGDAPRAPIPMRLFGRGR